MKVLAYTHIGSRQNNEDYFQYNDIAFTVCDGVGGNEKGEVASKLVCESFNDLIVLVNPSMKTIQQIILQVQQKLVDKVKSNPNEIGMGTTIASIVRSKENEYFAVHIGDSRIYHFKNATQQYWSTTDHSLVEEFVASGLITKEQAKTHPKKNVITKAIIGERNRDFDLPSISKIDDIGTGDIILICSDGVNEVWEDSELEELFLHTSISLEMKFEQLKARCIDISKDNNTAILMYFESQDHLSQSLEKSIPSESVVKKDLDEKFLRILNPKVGMSHLIRFLLALLLLGLLYATWKISKRNTSTPHKTIKCDCPCHQKNNRHKH